MKKTLYKFLTLTLLILMPTILAGCLPKVAQKGTASEQSAEFLKGAIARNFPSIPAYPKMIIVESYGDENHWGASFLAGDNLDKVVKFYEKSLGQSGWDSALIKRGQTYVFEIKNEKTHGQVIINKASDNKKTAITVWAEPR